MTQTADPTGSPASDTLLTPEPQDQVPERATLGGDTQSLREQVMLGIFIAVPFLAVAVAVPVAWGGWLGWSDVLVMAVMYWLTGHGVTVGFHRLFTHKSFKPNRGVKVALAIAGSMAVQGPVVRWVADHRKHHKFSDRDGDPHSPWRYGTGVAALTKGFLYAHLMWLFRPGADPAAQVRPGPDEGPRHRPHLAAVPALGRRVDGGAGRRRRAADLVLAGRRHRLLLGRAGPGRRCCTTSPGRSTRSATRSASGRSSPGTAPPTSGGWRSRRWASRGTTCTTPTRPARGTAS